MNLVKQIPNFFTLGNLACGSMAIIHIFQDKLESAFYLVVLAAVLDVFDGFLARALKVSGEMGKQLDSLADLVSFGVAPAFMIYGLAFTIEGWIRYAFILIILFSAYRLAKFNLDTRQSKSFIGVPTPITGLMCMSWAMFESEIKEYVFNEPTIYLSFCLSVSLLLLSSIRLPSLKIQKGPLKKYAQHILLLVIGLASAIYFQWLCIPIFYAAYVLSSILFNFAGKSS